MKDLTNSLAKYIQIDINILDFKNVIILVLIIKQVEYFLLFIKLPHFNWLNNIILSF